jgi:RNA polymerase sigma-70 factor (ECF subfamily)
MTDSDAALVARARLGDAAAMDALLRRYFRASFLVALGRLGNREDAEDVCQDAFVQCLKRLDDCREPEKFGAWLIRIVRNTAHNRGDYLRVRSTEPVALHLEVPSPARTDSRAERGELRATLLAALGHLTDSQRDVVLMHDLEGWPHGDIAKHLEIAKECRAGT